MSLRTLARLLGLLLLSMAAAELVPLVVGLAYGEATTAMAYAIGAGVAGAVGLVLAQWGKGAGRTVHRREALLVVAGGWVLAGLFGAIPLVLDGATPTYTDAVFETVSGFTTTGSTILDASDPSTGLYAVSRGSLLWRALTQWLGGVGIVVLFVAVFPQLGVGGKLLFQSEAPGPITEGLRPRIRETSATLWRIYLAFTAAAVVAFLLCGLDAFDAVSHALSTVATGGFATHRTSIAHYDSVAVEAVTMAFMLLAGANFSLYVLATRRQWRRLFEDRELRVYAAIVVVATLIVAGSLLEAGQDASAALRTSSFQVVSMATTTGFVTDDFRAYPPVAQVVLIALMFVGACAGSTGGGLKIRRVLVLGKAIKRELLRSFQPQLVRSIRVGRTVISEDVVRDALAFFALYVVAWVGATFILAALGSDLVTSTTAVAATLGNVGPGLAKVGALESFAGLPVASKWVLSGCMILGRLELVTVAALVVPAFWRR